MPDTWSSFDPQPPAPQAPAAPKAPKATRRSLRVNVVVGVLLAVFGAVFAFGALSGPPEKEGVWVLRARQAEAALTSLGAKDLRTTQVARGDVDGGVPETIPTSVAGVQSVAERTGVVVASTAAVLNEWKSQTFKTPQVLRLPLAANQQLSFSMLMLPEPSADTLKPGERLMSVSAAVNNAVAGTLRVGDRVTVVAVRGGDQDPVGAVLVDDVEIVGVHLASEEMRSVQQRQAQDSQEGRSARPSQLLPANPIPGIYTLRVSTADAVRIATAAAADQVSLVLIWRPVKATGMLDGPVALSEVFGAQNLATP